jgi:hypothetical protein
MFMIAPHVPFNRAGQMRRKRFSESTSKYGRGYLSIPCGSEHRSRMYASVQTLPEHGGDDNHYHLAAKVRGTSAVRGDGSAAPL